MYLHGQYIPSHISLLISQIFFLKASWDIAPLLNASYILKNLTAGKALSKHSMLPGIWKLNGPEFIFICVINIHNLFPNKIFKSSSADPSIKNQFQISVNLVWR